ncbi:MAG TPA: hypothetical protein VK306_13505 [Acidimicrobiales bacterium]|nr:hypothetical protein [Acidimicrobiales bacterium]
MSLWTPSGEHPVDRPGRSEPTRSGPPAEPTAPGTPGASGADAPLSPEEREQVEAMAQQVEEARRQLVEAPAGPVVGQQSLQFYELAALHLSQPEPKLDEARVAIDALAAVVDALGPRLGPAESPLRQALTQLQAAWVEASNDAAGRGGDAGRAEA